MFASRLLFSYSLFCLINTRCIFFCLEVRYLKLFHRKLQTIHISWVNIHRFTRKKTNNKHFISLRSFIFHEIKQPPVQADPKISFTSMRLKKLFNKFGSNAVLRLIRDLLLILGSQNSILYLYQLSKFETIPIYHTPVNYASFCYH